MKKPKLVIFNVIVIYSILVQSIIAQNTVFVRLLKDNPLRHIANLINPYVSFNFLFIINRLKVIIK